MYRDSERQRQLSISPFWLIFIPFFALLCSAGSTLSKFSFPFYSERLSTLSNQNEIKRKYSLSQNVLGNNTIHWYIYCCQGPRFEKGGALKFSCYFPSVVLWKDIYRLASLQAYLIIRLANYLSGCRPKAGDWISVIKYNFNYCDGAFLNDWYVTVKNNIKKA